MHRTSATRTSVPQGRASVRHASLEDGRETFTADLEVDRDGLVRHYPGLARRVMG